MYNEKDFAKMEFNPFDCKSKPMWVRYPALSRRKLFTDVPDFAKTDGWDSEFQPDLADLDKMIKFTALFIEPVNNPLAEEKDFTFRRDTAMGLAGIKEEDAVSFLIKDSHPWAGAIITEYFKLVSNLDYEAWFSIKTLYHKRTAAIREGVDVQWKDLAIDDIKKKVVEYENRLFPDERTRKMVEEDATSSGVVRWAEKFARNYDFKNN